MNGELKPEHRERFSVEASMESTPESIDMLAARFRQRLGKVTMPRDFMQGCPAIVKLLQRDEAIQQKIATSCYYFDQLLLESAFAASSFASPECNFSPLLPVQEVEADISETVRHVRFR